LSRAHIPLNIVHLEQRFSTCGPRPTGGPRTSAWWAETKIENWEFFMWVSCHNLWKGTNS